MLAISPEAGKALKPCVPRLGLPLKPSSAAPRCADAGSVLVQGIAAYCLVIGLLRNVKVECNGFIAEFVVRHESSVTRSHLTQLAAAFGGEQQTLPFFPARVAVASQHFTAVSSFASAFCSLYIDHKRWGRARLERSIHDAASGDCSTSRHKKVMHYIEAV